MKEELVIAKNVCKSFAGVQALDNVSISIKKGQIHCLVGENGSGKSTLIKLIAGVIPVDEGEIIISSHSYRHLNAINSIREGIQVIYQDLSLFPRLTVAENISLNQIIEKRKKIISWKEIKKIAKMELSKIHVNLDIDELVENLSMANKQIVAIVRALTQDTKLIIMDEPTASLTKKEIDSLFSIIRSLKKKGISTLFISHKISEVLEISERITILRDGKKVGEYATDELDSDTLIFHMTGKKINITPFEYNEEKHNKEKVLLEIRNLTKKGNYENINLTLHKGEILGLTGLLGSGRTEVALSVFGLNKPDSGKILIDGETVKIKSPKDAVNLGISYLPEDRYSQGLFLHQSIGDNIIVTIIKEILNKLGFIDNIKKSKIIKKWSEKLKIRTPSSTANVETLSGGNQQRVVLAKWLATNPKIFILDGPTIAIDIASKADIHKMIRKLANQDIGIIMISDETSEVFLNCNRIAIMREGKIVDFVDTKNTTEDEIFKMVNGKTKKNHIQNTNIIHK